MAQTKNIKAAQATADREADHREAVALRLKEATAAQDGDRNAQVTTALSEARRMIRAISKDNKIANSERRALLADTGRAVAQWLTDTETAALGGKTAEDITTERDGLNARLATVDSVREARDTLILTMHRAGMSQTAIATSLSEGGTKITQQRVSQVVNVERIVVAAKDNGHKVTRDEAAKSLRAGGPKLGDTLKSVAAGKGIPGETPKETPTATTTPAQDLAATLKRAVNGSKSVVVSLPKDADAVAEIARYAATLALWAATHSPKDSATKSA